MKKGPSRWGRLSPNRGKRSKLGRLTNISEEEPVSLKPLKTQYEKVVTVEKTYDPVTNQVRRKRYESYRLDERGNRIEKTPKDWAFGAWDIESHCYEHTCSELHPGCRLPKCDECKNCPACNPEHGDHWVAAQLSTLRIPDQYIEYVNNLDESEMFGGSRIEGGRYVEFLNGGASLIIKSERARCIAPDGCIDRTMRFLMAHPCFFQKAKVSKGYIVKGKHVQKCILRECLKDDGTPCEGCLRQPYARGVHTSKCRFERGFKKKDGTPCEGCSTLSTAWYSHFGGGYDINFALRWLSEHSNDFKAIRQVVSDVESEEEKDQLKSIFESRYQYKAESLLAGATHIQVKLSRLIEVYKPRKKSKRKTPEALTSKPRKPGTKDYWLRGWLDEYLPGGPLCDLREAQQTLNIIMKSNLAVTGTWSKSTEKAIQKLQKKCAIAPTGEINQETSAALRYLRTKTTWEPDPNQVILLRDSFRLVGSPLSVAAKDFDLKHPITGEKLVKLEDIDVRDPPPPDDEDFRRYCRIDTEICVQLVMTFNKLIRQLGGTLEMTASSCAVSLLRRRYLTDEIPRHRHLPGCRTLCPTCRSELCSRNCGTDEGLPPGKNLERHQKLLAKHKKTMHRLCPTYPVGCFHFTALSKNGHRHGGHVDVLRQSLEHGRCYDVNSLYPFAMLGPVPTGPMRHYICPTPDERRKLKSNKPLALATKNWETQKQKIGQDPRFKTLIEMHGLDFATLESIYRTGADRGPDQTNKPFVDHDFNKIDSFKRIRQCGFVEAIVSIPKNDSTAESYFPPLPIVRDSKNGEILFWPVGDGIYGWWCYEELRMLLEVPGAKLVALRQSVWFLGEPIFKDFIERLYAMRKDKASGGAMKQLLKILMNSTYGKTLQNPLKRRVIRLQKTQERPAGWLPTNPTAKDPFLWPWGTVQEYREAPFFLPHWGSLITARARTVIWRICVEVERGKYGRGKKVAYLDTDSCYTDAKLESGDELGMVKLEYALSEDQREKHFREAEKAWTEYQRQHEDIVASCETDASMSDSQKKQKIGRHKARLRYFKRKHYEAKLSEPKYQRARPEGLISCEFHGPKLYLVKDPETGIEVKAVHKGVSEPNAAKLRLFIQKQEVKSGKRAPKAGVGIRDDFVYDAVEIDRTGKKILWDKPGENEPEIVHKRVHHHDPSGQGTTSPRFISAHEEFELEESFRKGRIISAANLYQEWTGRAWPQKRDALETGN